MTYRIEISSVAEEASLVRILHVRHSSQSAIGEASDDPDAS